MRGQRKVSVVKHRYSYKLDNSYRRASTEGDIAVNLEYKVDERQLLLLKINQL